MKIPFSKYHGCGNDFVLVREADVIGPDASALAVAMCDRHCGVGADGLIVVRTDPLEMIYYNQDGSRAPMCGNGIRCFSLFCKDDGIVETDRFDVVTLAGTKTVDALPNGRFRVDMQKPQFEIALCGIEAPIWDVEVLGLRLYTLFMSTIHTVVFVEDAFMDIESIGRALCEHPLFHAQTNVNFVQIVDDKTIKVQTYERGCGVTLACGTGVCASAYVAHREKGCAPSLHVLMKKGALDIQILADDTIVMQGPAKKIAKGEYYDD